MLNENPIVYRFCFQSSSPPKGTAWCVQTSSHPTGAAAQSVQIPNKLNL